MHRILETSTSTSNKISGRLEPAIVSFICFCAHFVVLIILANLNFRNIPYLVSFLSEAAEAMNQNEPISKGLDSVKRFAPSSLILHKLMMTRNTDVYLEDPLREKCNWSAPHRRPNESPHNVTPFQWFEQQKQQQQQHITEMSQRSISYMLYMVVAAVSCFDISCKVHV